MGKMSDEAIGKEDNIDDVEKVINIFKGQSVKDAVTSTHTATMFLLDQITEPVFRNAMIDVFIDSLNKAKT